MEPTEFKAKIIEIRNETEDVKTFRIERPSELEFVPGQHCMVNIPGHEETRPFSLASSPTTEEYFEMSIKIYKGMTEKLSRLKPGNELNFKAPLSSGINFDESLENAVFIAGGTGLCPFMSAIRLVIAKKLSSKVVLFNSQKTKQDIIFQKELYSIDNPNIKIITTLTREESDKWKGLKGRITEELIKRNVEDLKEPVYYICGPSPMVSATKEILKNLGVKEERVKP